MVWKLFVRRLDECKIFFGLSVGIIFLCTILLAVIMHTTNDEDTTFAIGTTILVMITVFFFLFMGVFGYGIEFNLAIGMGVTRKKFIPAYFASTLLMLVAESLFIYAAYFLERWEINTFYSQWPYEKGIEYLIFSRYMILGLFLVAAAQIFFGAIAMKFGKKAFWILWILMMTFSILPSRIEKAADGSFLDNLGKVLVHFFSSLNQVTGSLLMFGLIVILLGVAYLLQRKQAYTVM